MNQKCGPSQTNSTNSSHSGVWAASACVRGVALQSVKNMRLLRCWENEASTRGCATVCDPAALFGTRHRHCSRRLPAAAVRERHQQHPKGPLMMSRPWVSALVAHGRPWCRARALRASSSRSVSSQCRVPTSRPTERKCRKSETGGGNERICTVIILKDILSRNQLRCEHISAGTNITR